MSQILNSSIVPDHMTLAREVTHWASAVGIIQLAFVASAFKKTEKTFILGKKKRFLAVFHLDAANRLCRFIWTWRLSICAMFKLSASEAKSNIKCKWEAPERGVRSKLYFNEDVCLFYCCVWSARSCLFADDGLVLYAIILGWVLQLRYLLFIRHILKQGEEKPVAILASYRFKY